MNLCFEMGRNIEAEWRNYWAMTCHSIWNWKNKEKHKNGYTWSYNPASVVKGSICNYALAASVIPTHRETQTSVVLVRWNPPPAG
jgi:hypothetical protein